ncbi:MAG: benzoate-CoA ligase family protein [Pirellulaceae bacterium]|nr:benzoate-CoA ligase family protein [Pirellulaceae bacterium]
MLSLDLPERLNAASVLVDAHLAAGRDSKAAILCGDRVVTYRDLYEQVNRFGNALLQRDIRTEERVMLLLPDSPEFAFAFFGAMKAGAVAVPLNTNLKPADYEYFLNDSRARVLVIDAGLVGQLAGVQAKHLKHIFVSGAPPTDAPWDAAGALPLPTDAEVGSLQRVLDEASPELQAVDTSKDDMAFWLYSSGTTGRPKGAIHLHHDMIVAADLYAQATLRLKEEDVSFSVAKLFFAYGLGNGLYFPLRVGATTVMLSGRPTPDAVFATLDQHQPTVFYSVPTSYLALLHQADKAGRTSLGRVRVCVSAGEPLPKHLYETWLERFGVEIVDGIGSTEILHIYISNRPGRVVAGSTGQVVPGYEAKIVDEHGQPLPPRQVGTLYVKGDSIANGYWNKHEETKNTFHGHWINTHDKFLVDEDGYFWYAGRTDDMFKVSGQAVWPTDVEGVLLQHPLVLESGVVGGADPEGLVKPVAFVVLKDGHPGTPELTRELQNFVKSHTAAYKYPRAVVYVESLPKTATGKIQRFKLRELVGRLTPLHPQPAATSTEPGAETPGFDSRG